jgi:hypothetical protein
MVAAAILSVLSIIAVGATFYRWWELGRPFSMGPLELASAFEAPLLRAASEDAGLDDNVHRRLVLGLATDVQRPRKDTMYI